MLEIFTGFPIWFPLESQMTAIDGTTYSGKGLLGFKNRNPLQIMKASEKIIGTQNRFQAFLKSSDKYQLYKIKELRDLMYKMLDTNPKNRISPREIIKHPFCVKYGAN